MSYPQIIQGGMGAGVSNWRLARSVSQLGQLGVVSGTFLDGIIARRLQDGDLDGDVRRALEHFPLQSIAQSVIERYYVKGGKGTSQSYKSVPMHTLKSPRFLIELTMVANFVEVFLAKEGHQGLVGINYLTKIELPILPSLYGAMLAGVDYVLMGAGIPKAIPGFLDILSRHEKTTLQANVENALPGETFDVTFNPHDFSFSKQCILKRPKFIAIVSSTTLAQALLKRSTGVIDGFVVEHHTAGGHNAPPRGQLTTTPDGEPIYTQRDECDLDGMRKLNKPFWLAGSYGAPDKLAYALSKGAQGIQVGTAFAFCQESGIRQDIKDKVIQSVLQSQDSVYTDLLASASGYPFKVIRVEDSISEPEIYRSRPRLCDLGYLRSPYKRSDGLVGFRCAAEPVEDYVKKGGNIEDTVGKKCLCNGLTSTIDLPQVQVNSYLEPPLVTGGQDLHVIKRCMAPGKTTYTAKDVLEYLLSSPVTGPDTVASMAVE